MPNCTPRRWAFLHLITFAAILGLLVLPARSQEKARSVYLEKGDRVAWVGSSSTNIGVWPKTM